MPVAIITGGAAGIGRHLCARFAREGYVVAALDIQPMSSPHPDIHCFPCDLRDEAAITSVFHTIAQTLGTPRVLVNNGAVSRFRKPFPLLEAKEFDDVLGTNLRGAFLCCREFVRLCRGTGYGRIINIASTRYQQNECGWEAYGASKGGLVSLTASLCVSLHGTGITVNAVSPGWIQVDDYDSLSPCDHSQHPSGRVGKPEDVCNACLFLAGEENGFVNGVNLPVDGGMTRRMIYPETDPLWTE